MVWILGIDGILGIDWDIGDWLGYWFGCDIGLVGIDWDIGLVGIDWDIGLVGILGIDWDIGLVGWDMGDWLGYWGLIGILGGVLNNNREYGQQQQQ